MAWRLAKILYLVGKIHGEQISKDCDVQAT